MSIHASGEETVDVYSWSQDALALAETKRKELLRLEEKYQQMMTKEADRMTIYQGQWLALVGDEPAQVFPTQMQAREWGLEQAEKLQTPCPLIIEIGVGFPQSKSSRMLLGQN
jgi:hypothetical protein